MRLVGWGRNTSPYSPPLDAFGVSITQLRHCFVYKLSAGHDVGNGTSAGHSEQCMGNVGESQKF